MFTHLPNNTCRTPLRVLFAAVLAYNFRVNLQAAIMML